MTAGPQAAICCVILAPALGFAADTAAVIADGRDLYFAGRYEEALSVFDAAEGMELSPEQRVEVYKFEAFILYLLKLHAEARDVWLELLRLRPDFELDPVEASPELIAFFERIELDEPAPPPPPVQPKPPPPEVETDERGCGVVLCMMPFGVGQFANGSYVKGSIFATAEIAFLATNVALYWSRKSEFDETGGFADPDAAQLNYTLQHVFFGLFIATTVTGIVDAYLFP